MLASAESHFRGGSVNPNCIRVSFPRDLLAFFADRLKVQLREQGARHDLVDAVFALGQVVRSKTRICSAWGVVPLPLCGGGLGRGVSRCPSSASRDASHRLATNPSPCPSPARGGGDATDCAPRVDDKRAEQTFRMISSSSSAEVEALGRFLDTDDGKSLLVGYRRAANILRDEEKKRGEPLPAKSIRSCSSNRRSGPCSRQSVRPRARRRPRSSWRLRPRHGGAGTAARAGRCLLRGFSSMRPMGCSAPIGCGFSTASDGPRWRLRIFRRSPVVENE